MTTRERTFTEPPPGSIGSHMPPADAIREYQFARRQEVREHYLKAHLENHLDEYERRWLFMELWKDNKGLCSTCGFPEGTCLDLVCTRTRVTNKLGLTREDQ